jgi:hypothetical protein
MAARSGCIKRYSPRVALPAAAMSALQWAASNSRVRVKSKYKHPLLASADFHLVKSIRPCPLASYRLSAPSNEFGSSKAGDSRQAFFY